MLSRFTQWLGSIPSALLALFLILGLVSAGTGAISHIGSVPLTPSPVFQEEEEEEEEVEKEEEEGGPLIKRPYIEVPEVGKEETPSAAVPQVVSLKKAAEETKHYAVKAFFKRLQVPHDEIEFAKINDGGITWLQPMTQFVGANPRTNLQTDVAFQIITGAGKPIGKPQTRSPKTMKPVTHYEALALEQARDFLQKCKDRGFSNKGEGDPLYLSYRDQLIITEQGLSFVHAFVRQEHVKGQRKGEGWDALHRELEKELLRVILDRLDLFIAKDDWASAFDLARQTASRFPGQQNRRAVADRMRRMLERPLREARPTVDSLSQLSLRLEAIQRAFPSARSFDDISDQLREHALQMIRRAKKLHADNKDANKDAVNQLLRDAERIQPDLKATRDLRLTIKKDILNVGVNEMPVLISPALAATDSEKQALELLYESLVELSPNPSVIRYRSVLAQGRPRLVPLGRKFTLPRYLKWTDSTGKSEKPLDASDVVSHAVYTLFDENHVGYSRSWAKQLVKDVSQEGNPRDLSITLRQGHFDPLSLMTFKILPRGITEDKSFAQQPLSSGPYVFVPGEHYQNRQPYALFRANPAYGERPGRFGQPRIREIRFFKTTDPVREMKNGMLHLATDLTGEQVKQLKGQPDLFVTAPLPTRRIYFLAVEQQENSFLRSKRFRRALAAAINRTKILDAHFRKGLDEAAHHELNGPWPVNSWAFNPALKAAPNTDSLHNPAEAKVHLNLAVERDLDKVLPQDPLRLIYPAGDPQLDGAMEMVKEDIEKALEGKVKIQLESMSADKVRERVMKRQYEIAYFHHDYKDHTYFLWPLLDPLAIDRQGTNYLRYVCSDQMREYFDTVMNHRSFTRIRKAKHEIHREFVEKEMPFIPLWQLDRYVCISKKLKLYSSPTARVPLNRSSNFPLDPLRIFCDVEYWRLDP